ncbi:MAG: hypothetical protein OEX00_10655 [Gammaproteobacteria bacterium]|nr:hypothetical protein [Gammaproteobacteria bacterium]MDH5694524.1 hypothetical protein [Gammaproteobacteria bacterium]
MPDSSKPYSAPLTVKIKHSFILSTLIVATHTAAFIAALSLGLDQILSYVFFALVLISLVKLSTRFLFRTHGSVVTSIDWDEKDRWFITTRKCSSVPVSLKGDSYRFSWLVVLHFVSESGMSVRVPIFKDSTTAAAFRCLKVRLYLQQGADLQSPQKLQAATKKI